MQRVSSPSTKLYKCVDIAHMAVAEAEREDPLLLHSLSDYSLLRLLSTLQVSRLSVGGSLSHLA